MRSVRTFTGKKQAQETAEESRGTGCSSHGCPLAGTISRSTAGGNWLCWAHDMTEEAHLWGTLTRGIEDHRWLFAVADRVSVLSSVEIERSGKQKEIDSYLTSRNRGDLARKKNTGEWPERVFMEPLPH